jgi:hypothetical protein
VGGSNFSCVFYDKFYRRICTYNRFNSVYGRKEEGLEAVEAADKHITMDKVYGLQCVLKNELKV